jgi:hypothetical protein
VKLSHWFPNNKQNKRLKLVVLSLLILTTMRV